MDWKFPQEIPGWLSEAEGRKLAELSAGKRVLEIGSYEGRSTVCIAQTAAAVECIDPFDGRGTPDQRDTLACFCANVQTYGLTGKVRLHIGTTEDVTAQVEAGFDLAFIDGAHDFASVQEDINAALRLLAPAGLLAFHDYRRPGDLGVTMAVDALLKSGATLLEVTDTLAVVRPGKCEPAPKPLVVLGMPRRGSRASFGALQAYDLFPTRGAVEVIRTWSLSTILDHAFNQLWACALNLREKVGATHFALIHDDVCPQEPGFLDVLIGEMDRYNADAIGVVIPIKTEHGRTSTAVGSDSLWVNRRLTMTEVWEQLPETFSSEDVGGMLLLNTGLWVCKLGEWCREPPEFQTLNRIRMTPDGEHVAESLSEDWYFSRQMIDSGCKLVATRKVKVTHDGDHDYPNDHAWGTEKQDVLFAQRMRQKEERGVHNGDQVPARLRDQRSQTANIPQG